MGAEFPILHRKARRNQIPWAMIAPHESQALKNHDQTLERLAERGGLAPSEAVAVLEDRKWCSLPLDVAERKLDGHVEEWWRSRVLLSKDHVLEVLRGFRTWRPAAADWLERFLVSLEKEAGHG